MAEREPDRFREFFDDAFDFGLGGSEETVRAMCLFSHPDMRFGMLLGCEAGYLTGHPENMLTFMATYVGASMKEMQADKGEDPEMHRLVARPFITLIEKSSIPHGTALFLTKNMEKEQRQATLDLVLRHASHAKNAPVVEALLKAGANANTMGGIAIRNAFVEPQDLTSLRALHKHAGNFFAAAGAFSLPEAEIKALDTRLTQEELSAKVDDFKKQATDLTDQVEGLKKALDDKSKPEGPKAPPEDPKTPPPVDPPPPSQPPKPPANPPSP